MFKRKTPRHYPKELSWLLFNERVLQEAENVRIPLVERLKFLGIFSSNQDEFYRVRVANLQRMIKQEGARAHIATWLVTDVLRRIRETVLEQGKRFDAAYGSIIAGLEKTGVRLINEQQLDPVQETWLLDFFMNEVRPRLVPIMLGATSDMPTMRDQFIYLAVSLSNTQGSNAPRYALIEIPTDTLPRFVILPQRNKEQFLILLEDVVRWGLGNVFAILGPERIDAWTIKVTRDAELELEEEISVSFIERLTEGLKRRQQGAPVRMVYDDQIPLPFLRFLRSRLGLKHASSLIPGSRTHNFKDFIKFPNLSRKDLVNRPFHSMVHPAFRDQKSVLSVIARGDQLLHFPYHSFNTMVDLLREAAIDPAVTEIQMTIYRASTYSSVLNALVNAVRNGKQVMVLLEVMARFDEENNLAWARRLDEEGVRVIFGVHGLKVHSKLCLITRREGRRAVQYAAIGTGNFNESTASLYTDHILMTCKTKITEEVQAVFNFFHNNYRVPSFSRLLVAPFNARSRLCEMIDGEIAQARKGKKAFIYLKLNNLCDFEMEDKLYEASDAGVEIRMIVRSMFSLIPQQEGLSENIQAISIVGRFLEHSRFLIFCNRGDPLYYLSSSDWMTRNLDGRVEVSCPILSPNLQREIRDYFETQWKDNDKARVLEPTWSNKFRPLHGARFNAQTQIFQQLALQATEANA
ncbi:MAG TPA: polyphosphate kinase 1 [Fibrobacteraceae bacterium]|nr:polyphosphate kinase 1 [Fibrobacteraceae bacterium]